MQTRGPRMVLGTFAIPMWPDSFILTFKTNKQTKKKPQYLYMHIE